MSSQLRLAADSIGCECSQLAFRRQGPRSHRADGSPGVRGRTELGAVSVRSSLCGTPRRCISFNPHDGFTPWVGTRQPRLCEGT